MKSNNRLEPIIGGISPELDSVALAELQQIEQAIKLQSDNEGENEIRLMQPGEIA